MPRAVHEIEKKLEGHPGIRNPWALAWAIYKRRRQARKVKEYRDKHRR